jgi:hypothetical protein
MSPATALPQIFSPVLRLDCDGFGRIFAGAGNPDVTGQLHDQAALAVPRWTETTLCGRQWIANDTGSLIRL